MPKTSEAFNASSYLPENTCSASILTDTMCESITPHIAEVKPTDDINQDELSALVKLSNLQKILIPQSDLSGPLMLVVNSNPTTNTLWEKFGMLE